MSCLLPLLFGVCLASPSEFSVAGSASRQVSGDFDYYIEGRSFGGATVGELRIQMDAPISTRLSLQYGWLHRSLLDTAGDRGEERAFVSFTYRPFARGASL